MKGFWNDYDYFPLITVYIWIVGESGAMKHEHSSGKTCPGVGHVSCPTSTHNYTKLCDFLKLLAVSVSCPVSISVIHSLVESRWATVILEKATLWSFNKITVSLWFRQIHCNSKMHIVNLYSLKLNPTFYFYSFVFPKGFRNKHLQTYKSLL